MASPSSRRNSSSSSASVRTLVRSESSLEQPPYHVFGKNVTRFLVVLMSISAMLSSLSSNVFFPAQLDIAEGLGVTLSVVNFSITTYLVLQGLAPSFWGPLADLFGRRVILVGTLGVYVLANIVLALTPNAAVLLVFRGLQSAGCASITSLGAGVIADIAEPSIRGGYMGMFSGLRQFGLAIGPVLGGVLTGNLGWRSIFWFLVIVSAVCLLFNILTLPETLRRISGNGVAVPRKWTSWPLLGSLLPYVRSDYADKRYSSEVVHELKQQSDDMKAPRKAFTLRIFLEPFSMLLEPDVACALLFGAAAYTSWSMMIAVTTVLFTKNYHFNTTQIGLCYLANGVGCILGSMISGRTLNSTFRKQAEIWNYSNQRKPESPIPRPLPRDFPIEKVRLADAFLYSSMMIIGFLVFGWSLTAPDVSYGTGIRGSAGHWLTPLLAQFVVGVANTAVLNSNNTLLVDLFPGKSSSASAVNNVCKNLVAAAGVAAVDYIEQALSPGWLGVVFAAIALVGCVPLWIHSRKGQQWRTRRESRKSLDTPSEKA